jgi:hypothetical protein
VTLPNFLVIGAAKAGTTAIWHYLNQHPQIYMSAHKEPRFFALCGRPVDFCGPGDMTRFRFVTDFDEYERLFDGVDRETAIGEASPWYFYVPSAAPAIKERLPDVKLVVILREPVERAFSNYLHAVAEGLEPLRTFREAMEAEEERIQAGWSPRFHYKQKGFYHRQLSHYLKYFDREQLRIYLYDDFVEDPAGLLEDLFAFLGVDAGFEVDVTQRHNVSRLPRSGALARILREGNFLTRTVGHLIPGAFRGKFREKIAAFNEIPRPVLSSEDRSRFSREYREDVLHLEELIGKSLNRWSSEGAAF